VQGNGGAAAARAGALKAAGQAAPNVKGRER